MCPADAEPGTTVKLPLKFSTVQSATPGELVDGALLEGVEPVEPDEVEADVGILDEVGTVVLRALAGELLLHEASTPTAGHSTTAIAAREKRMV